MKKIIIFAHGSAKGNPGPAAIGVQVTDTKGKVLQEIHEAIGNASQEYAEYFAVVRGLQSVKELFGVKTKEMQIELKLDSEFVKKQLTNECEIKDVGLIGHFIEIHNMRVASFLHLTLTHIQRKQNKAAQKLVNEALDA